MPGINRTGRPTTSDIFLGRGSVELAKLDAATGKPYDFRHVGNATAFSLNVETEKLDHKSSRSGVRAIDREIVLEQKVGITLTLDEVLNFDNLAAFLSGSTSTATNRAASSMAQTLQAASATKGYSYELRDGSGNRLYDLKAAGGSLEVRTASAAGAVLVEGTDYEVDRRWGTVFLLTTGSTHTSGTALYAAYTPSGAEAAEYDQVTMLTTSKQSVFLRYKGINPVNNDQQILVDLHSVSLSADGEVPLIGEEFSELTLTGVAERNETGYASAPTGRVYFHENA